MDAAGVQPVGAYGLFFKVDLTGATCTRFQTEAVRRFQVDAASVHLSLGGGATEGCSDLEVWGAFGQQFGTLEPGSPG